MRIVFMGTPHFAVPSLQMLAAKHEVVSVYTRPDAVSGRGNRVVASPVKVAAHELGIEVICTDGFSDPAILAKLSDEAPTLIVVVAFGVLLPDQVLELPSGGCINVHASLLPRWRGAAPIQRAILAGDESTGVSIMRISKELDTGDVCSQASTPIGDKNATELTDELASMGGELLASVIDSIEAGRVQWEPQDSQLATYAHKILKSELRLSPEDTAVSNLLRVQAAADNARARALVCQKALTVIEAHPASSESCRPGEVRIIDGKVLLGCCDTGISLERVKPDGKSEMPARDWVAGLRDATLCWEALV